PFLPTLHLGRSWTTRQVQATRYNRIVPRAPWFRLLIVAVLLGAAIAVLHALGLSAHLDRAALARLIEPLGPWGPLAFGALFAVWVFVALPSAAMNLAGGAIFGLWLGFVVNWLGCLAGACAGFFAARFMGREAVARRLSGRLLNLDELLGRH